MSEEREFAEREFGEVEISRSDSGLAAAGGPRHRAVDEAHVPRITAGPLAEPEDAWLRYRAEVARYYGAEGPVELAVVDRIVALQARIRRVELAERGALTAATVGMSWRRTVNRIKAGDGEWHRSRMSTSGVLGATNSVTVRRALNDFRVFLDTLEEGLLPEMDPLLRVLIDVYGCPPGKESAIAGKGGQIVMLYALARTPPPEDVPDGEAVTARLVECVHEGLRETERVMVGLIESLEDEERHVTGGVLESQARMDEKRTRALVQLERHLHASVQEAVRELERMVARRRLGEMARGR